MASCSHFPALWLSRCEGRCLLYYVAAVTATLHSKGGPGGDGGCPPTPCPQAEHRLEPLKPWTKGTFSFYWLFISESFDTDQKPVSIIDDMLKPVPAPGDMLKPIPATSDMLKPAPTTGDMLKPAPTTGDMHPEPSVVLLVGPHIPMSFYCFETKKKGPR